MSPSSRVDIVPQGEFHFEVRLFEGENDKRYRSWCLALAAAEDTSMQHLCREFKIASSDLGRSVMALLLFVRSAESLTRIVRI